MDALGQVHLYDDRYHLGTASGVDAGQSGHVEEPKPIYNLARPAPVTQPT